MNKNIKQFLIYFLVGGAATLTEWIFFGLFNYLLQIQYLVSTAIAFIISTFINWLLGHYFAFKAESKNTSIIKEIIGVYLASIIGLGLNLLFMFIFVDKININEMLSKIITTGIVFFYNFFIRKLLIYRNKGTKNE